jgi:hypothetical protein
MKILFKGLLAAFRRQIATLKGDKASDGTMLERIQMAHIRHFVELQHPVTGLSLDRSRSSSPASIAATGFALTAYPIAVERGWIKRDEAVTHALKVLRTLWQTPQGPGVCGVSGYRGFFYHFLDPATGFRTTTDNSLWWNSELSSIDTALLMAGVLFAKNYFVSESVEETEIRDLADSLYRRVDWNWLKNDQDLISHGWTPEAGLITNAYRGLSEAHLLYLLALGSPTHAVPANSWQAYMGDAQAESQLGQCFVRCPGSPMFVYQFPHVWIDFLGIRDAVNRRLGFDYFENSKRATKAQHAYAIQNPFGWSGYDRYNWGITASDGPGDAELIIDGRNRIFWAYRERGAPDGNDDGTIAPTAAISSLVFAPQIVLATLRYWLKKRPEIFGVRGFADAFNLTFRRESLDSKLTAKANAASSTGWVDPETVSIDQGPILAMIENYRTGLVWRTMKNDAYLQEGLKRAGFTGGWLQCLNRHKGRIK